MGHFGWVRKIDAYGLHDADVNNDGLIDAEEYSAAVEAAASEEGALSPRARHRAGSQPSRLPSPSRGGPPLNLLTPMYPDLN